MSARETVMALMREKAAMETEIESINRQLHDMGLQPGESLIDREGFPRDDLDLVTVRTLRNRLARLQTDHVQLMKQIEVNLVAAIPAGASKPASSNDNNPPASSERTNTDNLSSPPRATGSASSAPSASTSQLAGLARTPFALIDEVSAGSPAESAGLRVGDRVVLFGDVSAANGGMSRLPPLVASHENSAVLLEVLRGEENVRLTLTPRRWEGRGLLGCHLQPV